MYNIHYMYIMPLNFIIHIMQTFISDCTYVYTVYLNNMEFVLLCRPIILIVHFSGIQPFQWPTLCECIRKVFINIFVLPLLNTDSRYL